MTTFHRAAFIGSGLIGTGLAVNCVLHGLEVTVQTRSNVERCQSRIETALTFMKEKRVIDEEGYTAAKNMITYTTSVEEAVKDAYFITEAVPEKLEIKQEMIAQIEDYASAEAIIASSTSGLSITEIFAKAKHPERCIGGHPYLPSYLIPLVEVTKGQKTSEETAQEAMEFYRLIGKEPVLLNKEVTGFIANRLQSAIHREIVHLVMNGVCSVEDVDKALTYSVGIRWGIMGQALSLHLNAAPDGISNFTTKFHWVPGTPNKRVADLASWTIFPEGWDKVFGEGMEEELSHRPESWGRDIPSIEKWRDDMLFEILKLHEKF
ncbi:MAG: 3-hydroxyacyl-CoA dehydrogenase family protein [Parasporobacterium sp.]|nr:3-hydroxyacyl-CoA dehydrogenase family protein [Parasporobacterium sp.]